MENQIKTPFFSIIIPVYNVENYIEKCVQSVLSQSFKDYEIIIVNDGSLDNSGKICDNLAALHHNIVVLHKKNGGLSDARNHGINVANGEYLIFLDSDDYWDSSSALELIKRTISKDTELLLYGCKDYDFITNTFKISRNNYDDNIINNGNKIDIIDYLVESKLYPGAAWLTVTKKDFILKHKLFFLKGYNSEDIDWLFNIFTKVNVIKTLNLPFYVYVKKRKGSITNSIKRKTVEDLMYIISKWSNIFHNEPSSYSKPLLIQLNHCYMMSLICYAQLNNYDKKIVKEKIKSEIRLLQYTIHTNYKISSYIIQLLGITLGSKILYLAYKTKL